MLIANSDTYGASSLWFASLHPDGNFEVAKVSHTTSFSPSQRPITNDPFALQQALLSRNNSFQASIISVPLSPRTIHPFSSIKPNNTYNIDISII